MTERRYKLFGSLIAGIAAVSFAATFIRLADAPPVAVAALRLFFSTILLAPVAFSSAGIWKELKQLSGRNFISLLLSGFFLALHFITWISSLSFTGVASSVVFVAMSPLFVALYTVLVFREHVSWFFWLGLAVAIAGSVVLGGGDVALGGTRWKGDALAVAGAIAAAGYLLVGSRLRKKLSLVSYIFPVYGTAAVYLMIAAVAVGIDFTTLGIRTYFYCVLLALVCQVVGHSLFNWALKHLRATIVAIAVLGEPVGATLLAYLILKEAPGMTEIVGGGFILVGIYLAFSSNPDIMEPDAATGR